MKKTPVQTSSVTGVSTFATPMPLTGAFKCANFSANGVFTCYVTSHWLAARL